VLTSAIIIMDVCSTIFELVALFSNIVCPYHVLVGGEFQWGQFSCHMVYVISATSATPYQK
jgi:hypothetical protein